MTGQMRIITVFTATSGLIMLATSPAAAQAPYQFSQVTVSTSAVTCDNTEINSITNRGVLLGTEFCTPTRAARGFIDRNGKFSLFRLPGANVDTESAGMSNNGKYIVVDTQHNFVGPFVSYLRVNGKFHKVADPKAGTAGTVAEAVNNHKEIVGLYYSGSGFTHFHAFIERHGKFHTLHLRVKGAVNEAVVDVNDHGELAGYFQDKRTHDHGFLIHGHKTSTINAPGAGKGKNLGTLVLSIADNGTFCGNVLQAHGAITKSTSHGFIHRLGHYQSIRVPSTFGGHDTNAGTCNNAGDVAGSYVENEGGGSWQDVGYRATPPA